MEIPLPQDITKPASNITVVKRRGPWPLTTVLRALPESCSETLVLKIPILTTTPSLRRVLRTRNMEIGHAFESSRITNLYCPPDAHITTTELVQEWKRIRRRSGKQIPDDLAIVIPHPTPDLLIASLYATGALPDGFPYKKLMEGRGHDPHPLIDLLRYTMYRTENIQLLSETVSFYLRNRARTKHLR